MTHVFAKIMAASGLAVLVLAGCASGPEDAPAPQKPAAVAPPSAVYDHPAQTPVPRPVPKPEYKPMANDTCGANGLQYLVGKPRTEIPIPLDPGSRRVICSTCVTTQEYRADRQTIVFDSDTGLIKSITCG